MPHEKKSNGAVVAIVLLLALLAFAESVAWYVDRTADFQGRVRQALSAFEVVLEPRPADTALPWPRPQIAVRVADREVARPVYRIGNLTIPGVDGAFMQSRIAPAFMVQGRRQIFIVGESNALGYPYRYEDSFAVKLEEALGRSRYQVWNAAQPSWASAALVPLAKTVARDYRPDALVLLLGNNDWARWVGPGQSPMSPVVLAALRALSNSHLASAAMSVWVSYLIQHQDELRKRGDGFQIHSEITGVRYALEHPAERYAPFDAAAWHATKKRFLDAFTEHLSEMVEFAQANRVRVILMTVPFSYRLSPAWKHPQPESFEPRHRDEVRAAVAKAAGLVERGDCEGALKELRAAREKDPEPPILHYLEGMCLEKTGHPLEAEAAYARSRENMIGNLGARLSINERIASVAARYGVELVDLRKLFDDYEHRRGRYFNEELIVDDCHPTPLASTLIARELSTRLGSSSRNSASRR